jgi:hypothetical protein
MSGWTGTSPETTKFRLRVGNEQVALAHGVTLIGRDPSCRIAIFDTLISRRHARIQCMLDSATIEDLDSRNGTRVNGALIASAHALREGDRIGIGSYELVFGVVEDSAGELPDSPTGLISICASCRFGYPAAERRCPRCGSQKPEQTSAPARSEDTARGRWSLGLLVELLGKSMLTGRASEVEKLMREAVNLVNDELSQGRTPDSDELRALGEVASWIAKIQKDDSWTLWIEGVRTHLAK